MTDNHENIKEVIMQEYFSTKDIDGELMEFQRQLIAKVTMYDDKFEVELKSGLSVDITRNK